MSNGTNSPSKGILALRVSKTKAERITVEGETFFFRRLTIGMEEQLELIVRANQRDDLVEPPLPVEGEDGTISPEAAKEYAERLSEFNREANRAFRRITAEIMRFVLVDEHGKDFFSESDTTEEIVDLLNNVYANKFFKAYTKFREGSEVSVTNAESRFQK